MFIEPRRLPDQITLQHGPHDLLGPYFLLADSRARQCGVRLRLNTDFERLLWVNERHRDTWPVLIPLFHPRCNDLRGDSAFWIEGINQAGETVVTHAARLFDWQATDLEREFRSLRAFFGDPAAEIAAGASIEVAAPMAKRITGRVMGGGAVWVREDHRQLGLARLVPRISRAYAYTRWNTVGNWAVMEPHTHEKGLSRANGFSVEEGLTMHIPSWRGDLAMLLLWTSSGWMLDDVRRFLAQAAVPQATVESSRSIETQRTRRSPVAAVHGMRSRS
jgi:hypothetical protein